MAAKSQFLPSSAAVIFRDNWVYILASSKAYGDVLQPSRNSPIFLKNIQIQKAHVLLGICSTYASSVAQDRVHRMAVAHRGAPLYPRQASFPLCLTCCWLIKKPSYWAGLWHSIQVSSWDTCSLY